MAIKVNGANGGFLLVIHVCTTLMLLSSTVTHLVPSMAMMGQGVIPYSTFSYHIKKRINKKSRKWMDTVVGQTRDGGWQWLTVGASEAEILNISKLPWDAQGMDGDVGY